MEVTTVEEFAGFSYPDPDAGYLRIPNDWFDVCAQIDNLAELKVILYVMRRTWGFQKYDDFKPITLNEFKNGRKRKNGTYIDKGTGLGLTAIKDGIKRAVEHGYLMVEWNYDKPGWGRKSYVLRMNDFQ